MINLDTANPLAAAVEDIDRRTPVGSVLSSAEWSKVPVDIRQRSFFSAGVESMKMLEAMKTQMDLAIKRERRLAGEGVVPNKALFVEEMRELSDRLGIRPTDERRGTLQDIGSYRRLRLIWETNMAMAYGFAQHKSWHRPDTLESFPGAELVRLEERRVPRDWPNKWFDAMDDLGNPAGIVLTDSNRMFARLDSPIWAAISRFGLPYPPFDFNSGMGMRRLRRKEAIALGIIGEDDVVSPVELNFNADLSQQGPISDESYEVLRSEVGENITRTGERYEIDETAAEPIIVKYNTRFPAALEKMKKRVDDAFISTHRVMGDGPLPMVSISPDLSLGKEKNGRATMGQFIRGKRVGEHELPPEIRLSPYFPEYIELTTWHEMGHWLHLYGLTNEREVHYDAMVKELKKSPLFERLAKDKKEDPYYEGYFLTDQELFSRFFAQFVAYESEHPVALVQISDALTREVPSEEFWLFEEFKPLQAFFRGSLRTLGWLRELVR